MERSELLDAATELGIKDASSLTKSLFYQIKFILVLGQIFRSREQIRFLARNRKRQVEDEQKGKVLIFLLRESGAMTTPSIEEKARDLGLNIENPSAKALWPIEEAASQLCR